MSDVVILGIAGLVATLVAAIASPAIADALQERREARARLREAGEQMASTALEAVSYLGEVEMFMTGGAPEPQPPRQGFDTDAYRTLSRIVISAPALSDAAGDLSEALARAIAAQQTDPDPANREGERLAALSAMSTFAQLVHDELERPLWRRQPKA